MIVRVLLLLAVACSSSSTVPAHPLAMSDVSLLLPLPTDRSAPMLATIAGLVPENLVASLVFANRIAPKDASPVAYADFHVVAVRFDLCARDTVGPCPDGADGRLRLVLQPLTTRNGDTAAHDIALHALYPIPNAELPDVVGELRALAAIQNLPATSRLAVNHGFDAPTYTERLRALVLRYASAERLVKLTVIGQDAESAAFAWILEGFELGPEGFALIAIPNLGSATRQHLQAAGGDAIYNLTPGLDVPAGFALALNGVAFARATADEQRFAVEALAAIQNPAIHEAVDTQCVACHVATPLTARRLAASGIDPVSLADAYHAPYDLTVDTVANTDPRVVRNFGWVGSLPAISQRVANDSAHTVAEIEAQYP